jgi:UDP-N-acetylmuramoyl-tripeptide--D-alanyl-D-alanine ligase
MSRNLLELNDLLCAIRGTCIGPARSRNLYTFTSVATDSRNVVPGSLFVPLVGEHQDGHQYIQQAVKKGAAVVFLNTSEYRKNTKKYMDLASDHESTVFISVAHTLHALQDAAAAYVELFPRLIKIGVTGSSGKTTTKEMITALLKQKYNVISNEGNLNSETGVPLSVFKIRPEHEVGVFELGMNRVNEIGETAAVLKPQIGIVTNIGTAHIGILGSRQNIAAEKRKVFTYIPADGAAFIPAEDDFSSFLAEGIKGSILKYGMTVPLSTSGIALKSDNGLDGTIFTVNDTEINLKLPGPYNFHNALGAVAVARFLGVTEKQIKAALESLPVLPGRMEMKKIRLRGNTQITLLKDCYNANPDSMEKVLSFCSNLTADIHKIFVLGDMLELGSESAAEHAKAGAEAVAADPDLVIFIGSQMRYAAAAAKSAAFSKSIYIPESDDDGMMLAAQFIIDGISDGNLLLLKGSRGMQLERLIPLIIGREE